MSAPSVRLRIIADQHDDRCIRPCKLRQNRLLLTALHHGKGDVKALLRKAACHTGMIDCVGVLELMMDLKAVLAQNIAPFSFGNNCHFIAGSAKCMHQQRADHAAAVNQNFHCFSAFPVRMQNGCA